MWLLRCYPEGVEVGIREAKNDLSKLVNAAMNGESVIITKRGKPLVRLVPETSKPDKNRGRGCLKDIPLPDGWDSRELDDEIARDFEESL